MTSPSSPVPPDPDHASSSGFRVKLPPERIVLLREWVECTTRPFKKIGQELGISPATISRYAKEGGWTRPAGSAPPPAIVRRNSAPAPRRNDAPQSSPAPRRRPAASAHPREHIVERLWSLAERHAEILETQPIERAERSLQTLARLTRTLGEIDRHARPSPPAGDEPGSEYEIDAPKPRRSLHELRDELAAHLERIQREEGYGWEVREWWFMNGEGI
ncbi:hypothetical protein [Microvirga sp. Mcv34]|uniref:hypothetical protein n=1 Tax=Microvirga sp. Mcv34 TaxID=2926016 RepID=UPI0021C738FC|nr:hypothetical protein [Microvirga sp. Mcv34]